MFSNHPACYAGSKLKRKKFYLSAAAEYEKRLSGTCRFQLLELPECRLPESPQPSENCRPAWLGEAN